MSHDFTYRHYEQILISALKANYQISGFHDSVAITEHEKRVLYIRHDVDVSLTRAVKMAKFEAEMNIKTTYFVLVNSPLYNLLEERSLYLLQEIISLGHWLGLHIDEAMIPSLRVETIEQLVEKLLSTFGQLIPFTRIVSFHRPSPNVLNKKFSSFVSVYEPRFFSQIKYISDSRRMWREGDPCKLLSEGQFDQIQLLIHPIWYEDKDDLRDLAEDVIQERMEEIKKYLATNVSPFMDALYGRDGL